ncbi:MAG: GNAT family N-acetyltransferase [Saprospiraceae bacterium]|nr:GNAT family N-acetyltransferase [Saprospiraceae bacterium]
MTKNIQFRNYLKTGDLGKIIQAQALLYKEEYGYPMPFEGYLCTVMAEFYAHFDDKKDGVWICESEGQMVGFIALMHRPNDAAQLRLFYLDKAFRGKGLGQQMMTFWLQHCRDKQFKFAYLWTSADQIEAVALYKKFGFQLVEEKETMTFGKVAIEQKFELKF